LTVFRLLNPVLAMAGNSLHPVTVVILLADGARPDSLAAAIQSGRLPALARLQAEGGMHRVTSCFPSVTGPAYTPFLMGRFPGPIGLPGLRWFDRERELVRLRITCGMMSEARKADAAEYHEMLESSRANHARMKERIEQLEHERDAWRAAKEAR
jgi:hypothetical protein